MKGAYDEEGSKYGSNMGHLPAAPRDASWIANRWDWKGYDARQRGD